MLNNEQVV